MSKGSKFKLSINSIKKKFISADPCILQGIDSFASRIEIENLAFADTRNNNSGIFWGRVSAIEIFCSVFDPLLIKLSGESRIIYNQLDGNYISLPLASYLKTPKRLRVVISPIRGWRNIFR